VVRPFFAVAFSARFAVFLRAPTFLAPAARRVPGDAFLVPVRRLALDFDAREAGLAFAARRVFAFSGRRTVRRTAVLGIVRRVSGTTGPPSGTAPVGGSTAVVFVVCPPETMPVTVATAVEAMLAAPPVTDRAVPMAAFATEPIVLPTTSPALLIASFTPPPLLS
jgi:hypothetical protein